MNSATGRGVKNCPNDRFRVRSLIAVIFGSPATRPASRADIHNKPSSARHLDRRRSHGVPFRTQRLNDRRQDQPFDIGSRREVCAERVTFDRVQRPLQQRAEDRRLDVTPIRLAGFDQQVKLSLSQR